MSIRTTDPPLPVPTPEPIPPLRDGDRLTRDEFERRYKAMPHVKKAELLEGVVYMPSPVSDDHGSPHFDITGVLAMYRFATPGVAGSDNGTIRLDLENEPQPDTFLRIRQTHGGHSHVDADRYIAGAPELVVEVAVSSIRIDLNVRLPLYRRNGVREYILWRVKNNEIDWFVLRGEQYERLPLTPEGHYHSEVFPGLWLDPAALLRGDGAEVLRVAQLGIGSPEHMAFAQRLAQTAAARASQGP
jgi:Uma2 family endonuclease